MYEKPEKKKYNQRILGENKRIPKVNDDVRMSGYGYVIIPNDVERDNYLDYVYKTGLCMIINSEDNEIFTGVKAPFHVIKELSFPVLSGERGDLVHWSTTFPQNIKTITGIHIKSRNPSLYKENVYYYNKKNGSYYYSSIIDLNNNSFLLSLINDEDENGILTIKSSGVKNTSAIILKQDGSGDFLFDSNFKLTSESNVKIVSGSEDESLNYFEIDLDSSTSTLNSSNILIGVEADEFAPKGETTKNRLDELADIIDSFLDIFITHTHPSNGTPASNVVDATNLKTTDLTELKNKISEILSKKVKIE